MGTFLKQSEVERTKRKRESKKVTAVPTPPDRAAEYADSDDRHSRCVEESLDRLTRAVSTYVTQARDGENGSGLYTTPNGYPVKVTFVSQDEDRIDAALTLYLEGDAMDSIADSLKRIADAMTGTGKADATG